MRSEERIPGDAPRQSYQLLRRVLPARLQPLARGIRKRLTKQNYRPEKPFCWTYHYTQASKLRQDSILEKTSDLVRRGVEGDFVECGVLDGGTAALMAYSARGGDPRLIHLFDAWSGLPATNEKDGLGSTKWVGDVVGSLGRVRRVMRKVGADFDKIRVHRGWFEDTIPVSNLDAIAFLHIDCDFYEPTKLVLESFVPKVVPGGFVQIDDYTAFEGCRVAVNEFLETRPDLDLIVEPRGGPIWFQI